MPLQNDERQLELIPFPQGEQTVGWLRERINEVLRKVWYSLQYLEGRLGKIIFRSKAGFDGGVALGSTYKDSVFLPTNGLIVEGKVGLQTPDPKTDLHVRTTGNGIFLDSNIAVAKFVGRRQNASYAAPTKVSVDDAIVLFGGGGYGSKAFGTFPRGYMLVTAAENFSDTAQGVKLDFYTTPNGTIAPTSRLTIDNAGNVSTSGGTLTQQTTSNGASWTAGYSTELLSISGTVTTTDSAANLLPANSIIDCVVARVTAAIPGLGLTWSLGDPTTAARFGGAGLTTAINTTVVGLNHMKGSVATDAAGPTQAAADKVRVTVSGVPTNGNGRVRVTVFYRTFVAPTS